MQKYFEAHREKYLISTDPALLDVDLICDFLARAYWAQGRPRERTERALKNSLVFGLYDDDGSHQIGLARVISDYSIFAYLCDVFVREDYRGQGLGKWLMQSILDHPDLQGLRRWALVTRDAHRLYQRYGFTPLQDPNGWMEMIRPFEGE
jgi:GNAT superfamily N-acetyltransferase